uniref:SH2 domain-containing protein n=1 Tax=Stegastes partitus TaxID=144197 RepID=A0A3B5BHF7_9TELE
MFLHRTILHFHVSVMFNTRWDLHGSWACFSSKSCRCSVWLNLGSRHLQFKVSQNNIKSLPNKSLKVGDQEFEHLPALLEFYKIHYLDTTTLI